MNMENVWYNLLVVMIEIRSTGNPYSITIKAGITVAYSI